MAGNVFKRGKRWCVRVQYRGRDIWRAAPTKEAAQKLLGDLREDIARESVGLPKVQRKTLSEWAPEYMKWAKTNKRSWRDDEMRIDVHLVPALGHFRLSELTRERVGGYMQDRVKEVSPSTVNREVAILRKLLSYAVEQRELEVNPLRGIRLLPEPPPRLPMLSAEAEGQLLAACPPWLAFMARLAILTGCRRGELLALQWRYVDFDASALVIVDSKSGEARRVPLHPAALAELRERYGPKDRRPSASAPLIALPNGQPPAPKSASDGFRAATRKAGGYNPKTRKWKDETFKGLRFHDLRHVAGTRLLATGANLPEVATFLGHKTLHVARRYAHTSWTRLSDLVGRMQGPAERKGGGERNVEAN